MFIPTAREVEVMWERLTPPFAHTALLSDENSKALLCNRLGYLIEQAQFERLAKDIPTYSPSEIELCR